MLMQLMQRAMAAEPAGRPGNVSDYWFKGMMPVTTSGVTVTADNVMAGQSATVYTCVRILAEAISVLPILTYRRTEDGGRETAPSHPAWRLLHDRPNAWQTPIQFKQYMAACRALRGNAYALQDVDSNGNIVQLLPLNPDMVRPERLENGRIRYMVRSSKTGQWTAVPQDFMFHLASGISNDGVTGLSVLAGTRNSVGLAIAAENYGANSFKNGAVPSLTLTHPENLEDEARERLRQEWYETHGGNNARGLAVLDEGVKVEVIGMTNDDAQYLESRKFSRAEIAAAFRVPLYMLNDMESGAGFSSIEQVNQNFLTYTLLPLMTEWEQAANRDLILAPQTYYTEMLADAYMRADFTQRMSGYNQAWWMTGNEIRQKENMPKIKQPFMDEVQLPLNRGNPGGAASQPNGSNNSPGATAVGHEVVAAMAEDAFGRTERAHVRDVAKLRTSAGGDFEAKLTDYMGKHRDYMVATLGPVAVAATKLGVETMAIADLVDMHIEYSRKAHLHGVGINVDFNAAETAKLLTAKMLKKE